MEQIVVKTEVQPNGEILLFNFYVDESQNREGNEHDTAGPEQAAQYLHNESMDLHEEKYIIEERNDSDEINETNWTVLEEGTEKWLDEEIKKLVIFYTDNKEAFMSGNTKRKYLWDVACKTMLHGKNHVTCELKLKSLIKKYVEVFLEKRKGSHISWPYFSACQEAFYDNNEVKMLIEKCINETAVELKVPPITHNKEDGILIIQKPQNPPNSNEKVELMLNLYLKHKRKFHKNESQRGLWELIVLEMGEQDVDYWHRRFLNYKQHYIRMLHKQKETGVDTVSWAYMKAFNEIFKNDEDFHRKWSPKETINPQNGEKTVVEPKEEVSWSVMEKTFLLKYYFDCFHEFQDVTIPNMFLWTEVGRFLDKKADECKGTYAELKNDHINRLMKGGYDLTNRLPMDIVLDNIIAKETQIQLQKSVNNMDHFYDWKSEQVDQLVQYLYDNTDMLKDPVCYNICWLIVGKKCELSPLACKIQWEGLTKLYKSILDDKKENPDMSIDWRYMDLFDRIFDYGMATDLLDYPNKLRPQTQEQSSKIAVKKIVIKDMDENCVQNGVEDEDDDEQGFTKHSKKAGDAKAFKILEFYLKHKHKFSSSQCKRVALWDSLSKQIGISASECAHRFRNFKQVYKAYVKRELSKPEKPILWPYYTLCKKVFGYRSIKNKIKNELRAETDDEDWSAKDIKTLIDFFAINFHDLQDKIADISKWTLVANKLGRSNSACSSKFMELRKSYRKLKTMKSRNPHVKVSWKYFNLMDEIYSRQGVQNPEEIVETIEIEDEQSEQYEDSNIKQELQDEDYTIIVIPEGEDFSNAQYILPNENIIREYTEGVKSYTEELPNVKEATIAKLVPKWTKHTKKRLLILYLNYLRTHKGQEIKPKDMWTEIASKFGDRNPITCKRMFIKLKMRHKQAVNEDSTKVKTPYFALFKKILSLKPKYARDKNKAGVNRTYKDYPIDDSKVELALKYYLQNIDEFISPKFEKKYLWTELANYISEPVSKVYNKVNYLIQFYKSNTLEAENTRFGEILKEIFIKENLLNDIPSENKTAEEEAECSWTDAEVEILLTWYLAHLEKFKNPKFVRSYLWMEASDILKKSPWACSNKMSEIRTQYRTMVKENPEGLNDWKFATLCQRIYGTGKKINLANVNQS